MDQQLLKESLLKMIRQRIKVSVIEHDYAFDRIDFKEYLYICYQDYCRGKFRRIKRPVKS